MACIRKRRRKYKDPGGNVTFGPWRWIADYRDSTGKRHWETYDTRKEAERALASSTVAIKENRYSSPNDKRTVTDAYDSWFKLCVEGSDNKSGKPLRATTQALYSYVWRAHVEARWGALKLRQVDSEAIAQWKQEKLAAGTGVRTMRNALQILGAIFRHARRFKWTDGNPLENVHQPRHTYKVTAFTPEQIGTLLEVADSEAGLIIRTLVSTGMRFGELAGLRWSQVDLEKGVIRIREQYTHGAWSELKTENARRTIPLPAAVRDLLKARYDTLNGNVRLLHTSTDNRTVFSSPEGGPLDYHNWRARSWAKLLKDTAPDAAHPKRIQVAGNLHMLRHAYATALIQSDQNAKTVQTLMGHHSVAFTMDQYADAWPEAISNASEKAATLLFPEPVAKR